MLPKSNRLPANQTRTLLRTGKRVPSPTLQLIYQKNDLPVSRFAFVVSTKIDNRAVVRNRIRRLLREAVFLLLPTIKPGFDALFIVKRSDIGEHISDVQPKVANVLKAAGV